MRIAVLDLYPRGKGPKGVPIAEAVLAVQRQIDEHFEPTWGCGATLKLRRTPELHTQCFAGDLPSIDGIIYISPSFTPSQHEGLQGRAVDDTSAFHMVEHSGIPAGFEFPEIASKLGADWSVLLSHEALEMIIDPDVNLLVGGIHPREKRTILLSYEVCDPVQSSSYAIEDVQVSNFVLPQYYKPRPRRRGAYENTNYLNVPLPPFDVIEGGCYWFFDPADATWKVYPAADYGAWSKARTDLFDVPRGKRRAAEFLKEKSGWDTLVYGCANFLCGRKGGGN